MNDHDHKLRQLLKDALPPMAPDLDRGHSRDLWPQVLRRLEEQPVRVPWWDWALAGALVAGCLFFPQLIPVLLYHL